ncbi:nitrate reductase molybdenum cofactor assembly chaperone [Streptomyces sp. NPDC101237]|uniref:nitrate reductase molybdenum cofactor assembly chaperone n=1 Tax=Streptomyces sp. NPDC101237 TaxID=3366139 RepID=UPI00380FC476
MSTDAVFYQAAALCLTYPGDDFVARLPLLRQAAPRLREFTDHAAATPPRELAAHYEQVFDCENRRSLYLSRWQDAGARRRGMSLVRFKEVYQAYGMEFTGDELPDFLPAVLEFTARTGNTDLLTEHRDCLAHLRRGLADFGTPYASVLTAVCTAVPAAPTGTRP